MVAVMVQGWRQLLISLEGAIALLLQLEGLQWQLLTALVSCCDCVGGCIFNGAVAAVTG